MLVRDTRDEYTNPVGYEQEAEKYVAHGSSLERDQVEHEGEEALNSQDDIPLEGTVEVIFSLVLAHVVQRSQLDVEHNEEQDQLKESLFPATPFQRANQNGQYIDEYEAGDIGRILEVHAVYKVVRHHDELVEYNEQCGHLTMVVLQLALIILQQLAL